MKESVGKKINRIRIITRIRETTHDCQVSSFRNSQKRLREDIMFLGSGGF